MNILQVSKFDNIGGASQIAFSLFGGYRRRGHTSRLAVSNKYSGHPDVIEISNDAYRNPWTRSWLSVRRYFANRSVPLLPIIAGRLARLGEPRRWIEISLGIEDYHFPGTYSLVDPWERPPDILHLHNLHGEYFDLRALPRLSEKSPIVITMHDEWMFTGHCAHSLGCDRWRIGCGSCPDLNIPPAIPRDSTAYNWKRKRKIYKQSRLYVAAPCQWLIDRAQRSVLAEGVSGWRVIRNGVDLDVFCLADKREARQALGLMPDAWIVLFVGMGTRSNPFKDFAAMETAVGMLAERVRGNPLHFICLGEEAPDYQVGSASIRFVGWQGSRKDVAKYYQAADIYLHAARADTYPSTILEALACGTPVVATSVGGIPEQIEDGVTGFLVPGGDGDALAVRMHELLEREDLRKRFRLQAAESARIRFNTERMVDEYLSWFEEIFQQENIRKASPNADA